MPTSHDFAALDALELRYDGPIPRGALHTTPTVVQVQTTPWREWRVGLTIRVREVGRGRGKRDENWHYVVSQNGRRLNSFLRHRRAMEYAIRLAGGALP